MMISALCVLLNSLSNCKQLHKEFERIADNTAHDIIEG